ncbi:MAG: hypothetical protein U0Y10_04370 [Spirosomataceae bacterium]
MLQQELLKYVVSVFDANGILYMLTGSVVSSLQGEPRATHDIDIVIILEKETAHLLPSVFPIPPFYLNKESILEAADKSSMFNIIDQESGNKIDFWLLTKEPFDLSRFSRRIPINLFDLQVFISTPEDTILSKLKWSKLSGGSVKQMTDALRVFELQYPILDMNYLKDWVEVLQLQAEWHQLISQAEPLF